MDGYGTDLAKHILRRSRRKRKNNFSLLALASRWLITVLLTADLEKILSCALIRLELMHFYQLYRAIGQCFHHMAFGFFQKEIH